MKNVFFSLCFLASFAFAQNTVTDIDGNSYDYLNYSSQQWTVDNAAMETYRDGTPIPQVTSQSAWTSLTTGAWCYANNDSTNTKLYNWYAVAGIHDNDPNTSNKELAPEGWHIPTDAEWTNLEEFLIANGYNYDGSSTGNKIAKAMASTTGWSNSTVLGVPGNTQASNNSTNLAFEASGYRHGLYGTYTGQNQNANFWASDQSTFQNPDHPVEFYSWVRTLKNNESDLIRYDNEAKDGFSVRFVQDSDSCSEVSITASESEVCVGESVALTAISAVAAGSTACTSLDLPANLQIGLVGYWPFCGNANDVAQDNNGQSVGASLTTDRFENFNSAYVFNQNSHISLSEPFFDGNTAVSSFSYSTWIYVDQYPNSNVSINTKEGYWRTIGMFLNSDGGIRFGGSQPSPQAYHNIVSPSNKIIIQQWNHIVVTFDNSNLKIFINGVLEASTTISISSWNYEWLQAGNSTNTNLIGASNPVAGGVQNYFTGKIDDFSIWNRALSFTEITSVYNLTSTSYLWSTGDTIENISVTPPETTEYWVDVTTNGVTCRKYITINVTATAAPTGDAEQTFCVASTVADLSVTGENIQWYDELTGGNLLDATAALSDGQVVYASQTIDSCESTSRLEVTLSIQDIDSSFIAENPLCEGDSIELQGPFIEDAIYSWSGPAGFTSNIQNPVIENIDISSQGEYTLEITLNEECNYSSSMLIEVNSRPSNFEISEISICDYSNIGDIILDYPNINIYDSLNSSQPLTPNTLLSVGSYYISQLNLYGCESLGLIDVFMSCFPNIPHGFSPNNDGFNDYFNIENLYDVFIDHKLKIFNRYGALVFEGDNSNKWYGNIINSNKKAPVGTYFYRVDLNNSDKDIITGWVYLNY